MVGVREGQTTSLYVDGILVDVNDTLPAGGAINNVGSELRIAVNQPVAPIFYTDAHLRRCTDLRIRPGRRRCRGGPDRGGNIAYLYGNPGMAVSVFFDGFESGDTTTWSNTVP